MTWIKNNLVSVLVFGLLIGLVIYQRWPMAQHSRAFEGTQFPVRTLVSIDGKIIEPESLQKGTVLVSFWATWCVPCRVEMPALVSLKEELAGAPGGFEIIAISDESQAVVNAFLKDRPVNFPVVLDRGQELHQALGISMFPTLVRLKDGRIESITHGLDPLLKFKVRHSVLGSYF